MADSLIVPIHHKEPVDTTQGESRSLDYTLVLYDIGRILDILRSKYANR